MTSFARAAMLRVKMADHVNIAVVASSSKSARLIVSVTKSHASTKITTKVATVENRNRRGIRCMRMGELSSSEAKPRTMDAATLSCSILLTFSGMHPTSARLTPTTDRQTWATTAVPRRT